MARTRGSLIDDGGSYRLDRLRLSRDAPGVVVGPSRRRWTIPQSVFQHAAVLGDGSSADQIARLGPSGAEGALGIVGCRGFSHQASTGGYESVDPMLREVAYETFPRHAAAGNCT